MPEDNTKLNEMYAKMQVLDAHVKQVQAQLSMAEKQLAELAGIKEALSDLAKVEEGTEIWVPIAGGVFAKATLHKPSTLLVNVGAEVSVPKKIGDVSGLVDNQAKEIEQGYKQLQQQLANLFEQATAINEQISPLI